MTAVGNSEVYLLDNAQCEEHWDKIEQALIEEPELWDKWFTKEGILARIRDTTLQAWVVCEKDEGVAAVFLTQILVSELGKVLNVFWLKGELPEGALKCISLALDTFGEYHGCYRLYVNGRKGWERKLKGLGANFESLALSRPIHRVRSN
jgi:hypothetical protein